MADSTKELMVSAPSTAANWRQPHAHIEKTPGTPYAPYVMLLLALIGIADAFYVAHASYTGQAMRCLIVDGCNAVAQSPYARIVGVPLSYFGLLFYVVMFGLAGLLVFNPLSPRLRIAALAYTAVGVAYSLYGMYLQLSLIKAVCVYCLISAVLTVLLFIAAIELFRSGRVRDIA